MPTLPFGTKAPSIHPSVFVAPTAWLTGDVQIAADSSVFFGAVGRGDIYPIVIGPRTNIQEHAVLHTSTGIGPCIIGAGVTVGHGAIVHGATVRDNCTIGMGSTVLDGAVIGENSIVGAQALVPMNMQVPPGSLVLGIPAKVVRALTSEEIESIKVNAQHYVDVSREYRAQFQKLA
jgi:carbonic anhydrase/acetyltransferase-like protein (isoleucine patch superfamily)